MKILSFDYNEIKRDSKQFTLFNLFEKNILYKNLTPSIYMVPREFEMRLDRISNHLYGNTDYVEELMVLNDIINPYSVKEGQLLVYYSSESLNALYTTDQMIKDEPKNATKLTSNITQNKNATYNKSTDLKQIIITKDNKLKIINTFE